MRSSNILLFNMSAGHNPSDLSPGSNTWQVKNYEEIADTVYVLFLGAKGNKKIIRNGRTIILLAGKGKTSSDFFRAPWVIHKLVKRKKIKLAFTYEQVFTWWFILFVKMMTKCRVILVPLTLPPVMYKITKRSLSIFLPIWVEKILRRMSSFFVRSVIFPRMMGDYKTWLMSDRVFRKKIVMLDTVVEEVPSPFFLKAIDEQRTKPVQKDNKYHLLCISRLRKEKLIGDVLKCMQYLVKTNPNFVLHILGEGEDKDYFNQLIKELGIEDYVRLHGYMPLTDIIPFYSLCDVYVSAITGSALREVALFGMPVVAYEMDWLKGTFTRGINYLGVEPYNYQMLAREVMNIVNDPKLAESLRTNIRKLGEENWSPLELSESYQKVLC